MLRRRLAQLPNGLRVVFVECPHLHAVSVSAVVGCGARHDPERQPGIAHFVEHMLFRGSTRHPSSADLVAPIETGGGTLSGETWRDHTHFATTVHPDALAPVLAAMGDMLTAPLWLELEAERSLVQAELLADLNGDTDQSGDADLHNLSRAAIWRKQPMGRRITGTLAALRRFVVADLQRHHRQHYHAGNVVLALAGPVAPNDWLGDLRAAFGRLPPAPTSLIGRAGGAPAATPLAFAPKTQATWRDVATNQVALQLSYAALPDDHVDFTALQLLTAVLDDGMGTRLHRALSEATGLVYAFHSGLDCYRDGGIYELEMQLAPERTAAAVREALACFAAVAGGELTEGELARAKRRAELACAMGRDAVDELAYEAALDVLFARPSPQTLAARRARATVDDLTRLARATFAGPRHLTVMGPMDQLDRLALARALRAPPAAAGRPARSPQARKAM